MRRRALLAGSAAWIVTASAASAETISGAMPWRPYAGEPPKVVSPVG